MLAIAGTGTSPPEQDQRSCAVRACSGGLLVAERERDARVKDDDAICRRNTADDPVERAITGAFAIVVRRDAIAAAQNRAGTN